MTSGDFSLAIGSHASVTIGPDCVIGRLSLNAFGEGARIDIGREVGFAGAVSLSTHEGAQISSRVGRSIAGDTVFSASDFPPGVRRRHGERINHAERYSCREARLGGGSGHDPEGASVGHDSVVGAGSIVTAASHPTV